MGVPAGYWRRDFGHWWLARKPAPPVTRRSWSMTLIVRGRTFTIGHRNKGWVA